VANSTEERTEAETVSPLVPTGWAAVVDDLRCAVRHVASMRGRQLFGQVGTTASIVAVLGVSVRLDDDLVGWVSLVSALAAGAWMHVWWAAVEYARRSAGWPEGAHAVLPILNVALSAGPLLRIASVRSPQAAAAVLLGVLLLVALRYWPEGQRRLLGRIVRKALILIVTVSLAAGALGSFAAPLHVVVDRTERARSRSEKTARRTPSEKVEPPEPEPGTDGAPSDEDGRGGAADDAGAGEDCVPIGDGQPADVKEHIERAARVGVDPDFGCGLAVEKFADGSIAQWFADAEAVLVASSVGAAVINGPAVRAVRALSQGDFSSTGIGGQLQPRIDCWRGAGDFHVRLDRDGRVNGLLSRAAKVVSLGERETRPGDVYYVPPELLDDYFSYLGEGTLLAAIGPASTDAGRTTQWFVDPTDDGANAVLLTGSVGDPPPVDFDENDLVAACQA
jgi:hypothetical protein